MQCTFLCILMCVGTPHWGAFSKRLYLHKLLRSFSRDPPTGSPHKHITIIILMTVDVKIFITVEKNAFLLDFATKKLVLLCQCGKGSDRYLGDLNCTFTRSFPNYLKLDMFLSSNVIPVLCKDSSFWTVNVFDKNQY